jgi:ABC-2 type transporter
MLVAKGTRFLGLENITDGLSSQDSFNIVKELKDACKSFQAAAVMSLNQPSDEIVQLFDNLLVLNHAGELTYFGPPNDRAALRQIFVPSNDDNGTSGMSICDLCLNPMMDEDESTAIRERYLESPDFGRLSQKLRELHSRKFHAVSVQDLLPDTKYASGMQHAFKVLGKRRAILIMRNPSTYLRIVVAVFFGVVVGSLFSVLEQDLSSSLARTAYMFQMQFLVLLLSTGVTVPQVSPKESSCYWTLFPYLPLTSVSFCDSKNIRDRVTYFKHRASEFYSSRVYYICQILYEIPLSVVEAILISVTSYFWVDMNPRADRFFFFMGGTFVLAGCAHPYQCRGALSSAWGNSAASFGSLMLAYYSSLCHISSFGVTMDPTCLPQS